MPVSVEIEERKLHSHITLAKIQRKPFPYPYCLWFGWNTAAGTWHRHRHRHRHRLERRIRSLTASLISSLCSSVNRFNGFESCEGPCVCECTGGWGGACCVDFAPSAPNSPGPVAPRPRCREKDDALKGIAFAFTDRSGSLPPPYEREPNGWWADEAMMGVLWSPKACRQDTGR